MSIKYGSNRFFPRGDSGGGGGGADLWTLYGGTVVGLTTLTDTVAIGTNAMLADEKLLVAGGIAATPTIAGNDAFLQVGSGDSTVLSGANSVRFIYNAGTMQAEISTNGGAFVPLASGGASPWLAAAGVITEVVPANLVVVGSAAALNADQLQVLGNATLRAAADSTSTFAVEDAATNPIFQIDTVNNASVVTGSYQMSSGLSAEVYLESGPSTAAVAGAGAGRIRYNNAGTPSWQGSVNGGAFSDFITAATLPSTAFVNGGNTFASVDATLGTNNAGALIFETNNTARGRFLSTGQLLINYAALAGSETFGVSGSAYVTDARLTGANGYLESVTSAAAVSNATEGRLRYSNAALAWQVSVNGGAYVDLLTSSALANVFVQNGNTFGADAVLGTNDAFALQFETSGTTRGRFTSGGLLLVNAAAAVSTEQVAVAGGIASNPTGAGNDAFLAFGNGAGVAVSTANAGRFRYNAGVAQVSLNTGAYVDLITSSSLPTTAFVQNGNTFGLNATLGTNDAFALIFETNGSPRGRFLSTGEFIVNQTVAGSSEILGATQTFTSGTGTKYAFNITSNATTNNDTGAIWAGRFTSNITGAITAVTFGGLDVSVGQFTTGTISQMHGIRVFSRGEAVAALGTVSSNFTIIARHGYAASVTSGTFTNSYGLYIQLDSVSAARTIVNAYGIQIQNHGGTGVTSAIGIDVVAQTGAASTNIGLRVQGNGVFGGLSMSSTEALRVTGTGFRSDGTSHVVAVSTTFSINNSGGPINIGDAANAQGINIGTGAAARSINIGNTTTTSSIANSFGTNGFGLIQGAATSGTPVGVLMTAAAHTGLSSAEVTDVNFNLARTVTFGAGGGTVATQRAYRIQAPTYAAAAAITLTDAATLSIGAAPTPGALTTITRSMAIWVQGGVARFDGGVGVKVTPGGTTVQGLGADFRKTNNPGSVSYPAGVSTVSGGAYTPATGYLSIIPALWTLPAAINSGGGVGPPLNPGIRFNWSDGTTTIRYNTSTASSLTETRDSIDFNKDGLAIVGVDFVVDNTSGGAATVDFTAWTVDGNQF